MKNQIILSRVDYLQFNKLSMDKGGENANYIQIEITSLGRLRQLAKDYSSLNINTKIRKPM